MHTPQTSRMNERLLSPEEVPVMNGNFRIPALQLYRPTNKRFVLDALTEVILGQEVPEQVIGRSHNITYGRNNYATSISLLGVPAVVVLAHDLYRISYDQIDPFLHMSVFKRNRLAEEVTPRASKLRLYSLEKPADEELATFFRDWTLRYINMIISEEFRF